jgi:methylamine utilization protein MauE
MSTSVLDQIVQRETSDGARHALALPALGHVTILVGLVLLVAAVLKGYELATEPVPETSLFTARWFLTGLVEFELMLGLWLVSGLHARASRSAALLSFTAFGIITLYKGVSGEASCGCFGKVEASPWHVLGLDIAVVAALWFVTPAGLCVSTIRVHPFRFAGFLLIALLAAIPGAALMIGYTPAALADDGGITGDSSFVVLEPQKWLGKPCPLLRHIDIGNQLATGTWTIVLYRNDCPHCRQAIPEYESKARSASDGRRIALIELPSQGYPLVSSSSPCMLGRISDAREWFVEVPVRLDLSAATVTAVVEREHAFSGN